MSGNFNNFIAQMIYSNAVSQIRSSVYQDKRIQDLIKASRNVKQEEKKIYNIIEKKQ